MKKLGDVITGPETWCRHYLGLTVDGESVKGADPKAVQRCLLGGLQAIHGNNTPELDAAVCRLDSITIERHHCGVVTFNNFRARSFDEIKVVIDEFDKREAERANTGAITQTS